MERVSEASRRPGDPRRLGYQRFPATTTPSARLDTPHLRESLLRDYPTTTLSAALSTPACPLQPQMGNWQVGHLNIGSGRIIYQDLTRITRSIEEGDFFANPAFTKVMDETRKGGGKLHLMGLLSDGGVHSHNTHLYALVELARRHDLTDVCIHAFLDYRDTPPKKRCRLSGEYSRPVFPQTSTSGGWRR